jgi:phosphatidylglycerol:prolipoprotein diacylglycerol transferase
VFSEIFQLGPVHIRSYGVMLAVAFLVGTMLALREARRLRLDPDKVVTVVLVSLIAGVLGARAMYVIEHVEQFRREWGGVVALWQGGLTLYGGVVAGTLAGLVTSRRLKLPMWSVADALTPSLALGMAFGRVGCFLNGCCYGRPTSLPWGVTFPGDSFAGLEFGNVAVHPSQLYFSLAGLVLFALAWIFRTRIPTPGVLYWSFIALFGLIRLALDFTRAYEPETHVASLGGAPVTESQIISLAMMLFAALMIVRLRRRAQASEEVFQARTGTA